ncbi:hypothetical protein Syun_006245 [Stephania yunnanensis]|uniref:Myb-like protein X n=1 Tax=Stephania yunnanensis TaxID=152371 RepID=A0AAP0KXW5_9MAGN
MSRCFPFPPPGYEKKARTDDVDLLTKNFRAFLLCRNFTTSDWTFLKVISILNIESLILCVMNMVFMVEGLILEKHKEKKHKKDRKDKKDKKEGKEKKDKERSKDKKRDKKERKEKRREKKKEKSREKDKPNVCNEIKKEAPSNEAKLHGYNGGEANEKMQNVEGVKDSKFVEELCKRIGNEGSGTRIYMAEDIASSNNCRAEGMAGIVDKDIDNRGQGKEIKVRKRDDGKMDNKRNRDEERGMANAIVPNFSVLDQRRVSMAKEVGKEVEKKMEGKEKNKELGRDNKEGNGLKEKDREKKSKGHDGSREKGKKTDKANSDKRNDTIRGGKDLVTTPSVKPLYITKGDLVTSENSKLLNASMGVDKNHITSENLKKRKEYEANGFLHGNDVRPNKLPKPEISHPFVENGRKLEHCQTPLQQASGMHLGANNFVIDKKECKVNDLLAGQTSDIKLLNSSATATKATENGVALTKPPHPDSKYLKHVLSVPKMGEWSEFDDQEWLLGSNCHEMKQHKHMPSLVVEKPQVWDKAIQIESDDICVLPYVIPY